MARLRSIEDIIFGADQRAMSVCDWILLAPPDLRAERLEKVIEATRTGPAGSAVRRALGATREQAVDALRVTGSFILGEGDELPDSLSRWATLEFAFAYRRRGRPANSERDAIILRELDRGTPVAAVAQAFNLSPDAIRAVKRRESNERSKTVRLLP